MAPGGHRPLKASSFNNARDTNSGSEIQHPAQSAPDEQATLAYIRRVLCQQPRDGTSSADAATIPSSQSLEELLPPLTSSNAVDVELYAFIAVVLSFAVQSWYQRVTPDHQFVGEIVRIIAHCTRGLEGRLRNVDLESLILDEVPALVTEHVNAVRIAQSSQTRLLNVDEKRQRYHALRPHMAMEPVPMATEVSSLQQENEVAWCLLLVHQILPLLLPPEDMQNPCLNVLVSEIFSELIFHNGLCGKACEPWLLWEAITKAIRPLSTDQTTQISQTASLLSQRPSAWETRSSVLGAAHEQVHSRVRFDAAFRWFWLILQSVVTFWILLRSFSLALMQASSIPARTIRPTNPTRGMSLSSIGSPSRTANGRQPLEKRPIVSMRVWGCMSQLLSLDRRLPWLTGMVSLLQWMALWGPGRLSRTNSRLDRLLSFTIQEKLLHAGRLPSILRAARVALFPDNAPSPARTPPTVDQVAQIRRDCAAAIVDAVPEVVRARIFATEDPEMMRADVATELDLLADAYMNKNLIVGLVELLVVRLLPELTAADAGEAVDALDTLEV